MGEEETIRDGAPTRPRSLPDSVLQLIWRHRRISRAEIARRAELSRSTVSSIVGSLLPTRLVSEVGTGPSSGGRPAILLEFQDDVACVLGVEMGASHVAVALTDLRGRVVEWRERDHPVRSDPVGTRALIAELCDECLRGSRHARGDLVGIGVALPSPVNPSASPDDLASHVVLPSWEGRSGMDELRSRFGVPVLVDNDANLGALAEHWWGDGVGIRDFAYVKIGTGVGAGHVIDGEIYRGATGVAGEIGHLAIDPKGEPCVCGLRGCLTTFVGSDALVARAGALKSEFPHSSLNDAAITVAVLEDAALAGDALALRVTEEAAEYLGIAIAGLLNLMNPQRVILGGGLARLGELLLRPLRETVRARTLVSSLDASDLRTSRLGPRSVAVGAATLVLKAALEDSRLFPTARALETGA